MDYIHLLKLVAALSGQADATAFAPLHAGGANAAFPVTIGACVQPLGYEEIEGETVICGSVNVPENHSAPDGRRIDLQFAILKSSSSYPEPDPLIQLHGGPGGGMVDQVGGYAQIFDAWRKTRDVVLFDQRAAGLSGSSVACYKALGSDAAGILELAGQTSDQAMSDCIAELEAAGVDLAAYNTTQNALDVSSLAKALGYDSYNLYGISYGTKLALEVMRSAPEGLRAVIIDGVVPPQVKDYDTTAVPADEAINLLVEQCAADAACNAAYPDLGMITRDLLDQAAAGTLTIGGSAVPPSVIVKPILARNGQRYMGSLTPYIPAYIYEIYRGTRDATLATPTIDMLDAKSFTLAAPADAAAVTAAAANLPADQKKLVVDALSDFAADVAARSSLQQSIWDLFAASRADDYGPIVQLFDAELTSATTDLAAAADSKQTALAMLTGMVADYVGLQNAKPSREALLAFVDKYFTDAAQSRLRALVAAMRESEIEGSFELIRTSSHDAEADFLLGTHLALYACQEGVPFNSPEGYDAVTPTLHFPGLAAVYQSTIKSLFSICSTLTPQPREGFHEPVVSNIPTLSIGSAWDVQTASSWAALAVSTLANGQSVLIPEAGHGAVIYQPCVVDMGVAFINNPTRTIDDSCAESLKPSFYIAPWVEQASTAP